MKTWNNRELRVSGDSRFAYTSQFQVPTWSNASYDRAEQSRRRQRSELGMRELQTHTYSQKIICLHKIVQTYRPIPKAKFLPSR